MLVTLIPWRQHVSFTLNFTGAVHGDEDYSLTIFDISDTVKIKTEEDTLPVETTPWDHQFWEYRSEGSAGVVLFSLLVG